MKQQIFMAVIASLITAIIMFAVGSSLGAFEKKLGDSQIVDVADELVNDKSLRSTLLDKMTESGKFKGGKGEQGNPGKDGKSVPFHLEKGVISITENRDYTVKFAKTFATPPIVTLGASTNKKNSKGEIVAMVIGSPNTTSFDARIVYVGAGTSKPGEFATGAVYWVAIEE